MFKSKHLFILVFFVVALGVAFILFSSSNSSASAEKKEPVVNKKDAVASVVVPRKFGLALDSFNIVEKTIQRNEFLASILQLYHVDIATITTLAAKSKEIYDVRKIMAGRQYTVFCTKDSLQKAQYFVYQPNAIDYIVYDLRDSVAIYTGKRKVTTRMETASGVITSSLYETLEKAGTDPALAMKLSDMYAWAIDFYSIKKGDWFKVIYEQRYIKDEPVEPGAIQSAIFSHGGEEYHAFYFEPDSIQAGDYYDENGKSLRKAFLKAPLKFSRITSRYTLRRFHPVQKRWKAHLGTDYGAPTGTPIISTGNGVVIESRYTRNNGNYVKIRHNRTYTTQYLHMSRRAVRTGQHISQGQVIGYVGSTGLATGPHVCYRFWKNGKQVDPLRQKFPSATPVPEKALTAFETLKQEQVQQLNTMAVDTIAANKQ